MKKIIILATVIEGDETSINKQKGYDNTSHKNGLYEQEAIKCFTHWRKNAGWLKDIRIIAHCPTKNTITQDTQNKLKELNVEYIENYQPETENYVCGFWNIPLSLKIIEETEDYNYMIHIDLDMNLINPLPKEWFEHEETIVGQYDELAARDQRDTSGMNILPLDTGFVISKKGCGFYKKFYEDLKVLTEGQGDDYWKSECKNVSLNFLEEYAVDKMYANNTFPIKPIRFYQIGEEYTDVDNLTDEQLKTVCFIHEHIVFDETRYDPIKTRMKYRKRIQNIK